MTFDPHDFLPAASPWGGESVPTRDRQDTGDGGQVRVGMGHPPRESRGQQCLRGERRDQELQRVRAAGGRGRELRLWGSVSPWLGRRPHSLPRPEP